MMLSALSFCSLFRRPCLNFGYKALAIFSLRVRLAENRWRSEDHLVRRAVGARSCLGNDFPGDPCVRSEAPNQESLQLVCHVCYVCRIVHRMSFGATCDGPTTGRFTLDVH